MRLALIIAALTSSCLSAQESKLAISDGFLSTFSHVGKVGPDGARQGNWFFYEDDLLQVRGEYLEGAKTGVWITYAPDSSIEKIAFYGSGALDGPVLVFHPSGALLSKSRFRSGIQVGRAVSYSQDGSLVSLITGHDDNGRIHGDFEMYKRGVLFSSARFENGEFKEWIREPDPKFNDPAKSKN